MLEEIGDSKLTIDPINTIKHFDVDEKTEKGLSGKGWDSSEPED